MYEFVLITTSGKIVAITAIGLPSLAGPVSLLDETVIAEILPDFDMKMLQRPISSSVDLLHGGDYFALHPKDEITSDSKNLSVMKGELGICVQGSHPCLKKHTQRDKQVGYVVRVVAAHRVSYKVTHPEFEPVLHHPVVQKSDDPDFVMCDDVFQCAVKVTFVLGEQLGTEATPKCSVCKCGKCPVVGHSYSFQEEQELKLINSQWAELLRIAEKALVKEAQSGWTAESVRAQFQGLILPVVKDGCWVIGSRASLGNPLTLTMSLRCSCLSHILWLSS